MMKTKKRLIGMLCAAFFTLHSSLLTSCSGSDSVEGNTEYFAGNMISMYVENAGLMYFWDNGDGTVSVTYDHRNPMHTNINSGTTNSYYKGVVSIPSSIMVNGQSMTVVGITEYAFMNCTNLTKVVIPATVKSIGKMAFYNCSLLEEVEVKGSLTEIPDYCFSGCKALKKLTVAGTVNRLGVEAFTKCSNLTDLRVPDGVTMIDNNCFLSAGLNRVVLPETLTRLRKLAFNSCSKLKEIGVPKGITALEDSVFYGCSALLTVYLPQTMTSIGVGTFSGCRSLMEMDIPASVQQIGAKCFYSEDTNGNPNMKSLILNVMATTPPILSGSITNATDYSRIVVPKGCRDSYLNAPYWSEFTQVMERNY